MSRKTALLIAAGFVAFVGFAHSALAQGGTKTTVKPAANFCVFADRSYSKGAMICFGSRISMECGDDQRWKVTGPGGGAPQDIVVVCRDAPFPKLDNVSN